MDKKYFDAIITLGEVLIEKNNELKWKDIQLEAREKELEKLKLKLEYIENYIDNVPNRK